MQLSHHELHILHHNVDSITRRYGYVPPLLLWLLFFFFLVSSCSNGQSDKLYPCAYIIMDRSHGGNIVRVGTRFTILSHHLPLFLPPFLAIECSIKFSRWRRNRRLQWSMEKLCQIKVIYKHRRVTLTTSKTHRPFYEKCAKEMGTTSGGLLGNVKEAPIAMLSPHKVKKWTRSEGRRI